MTDDAHAPDFETILAASVHDMKNTLALLSSSLDELVEQSDEEDCASGPGLHRVRREARRLNSYLVQLLTLYKLGRGLYGVNLGEHVVAEFLDEALVDLTPLLGDAGIGLEIERDPELVWFLDAQLIMGVLTNLVHNALRYTRDRIRVSAVEEDGWLRLSVEDNGEGYPPVLLEAARAAPGSTDFHSSSTGLGIYFCEVAARAHVNRERAGRIALDNDGPLGGGRFTVYLP